jgi:hypothetical protein
MPLESPVLSYHGPFPHPILPRNPRLAYPVFPPSPRSVVFSCRGVGIQDSPPKPGPGNGVVQQDWKLRSAGVKDKDIDVATLGNLCVDIVLGVPKLPPKNPHDRKAFMDRLSASPPDKVRVRLLVLVCELKCFNFFIFLFSFFFFFWGVGLNKFEQVLHKMCECSVSVCVHIDPFEFLRLRAVFGFFCFVLLGTMQLEYFNHCINSCFLLGLKKFSNTNISENSL